MAAVMPSWRHGGHVARQITFSYQGLLKIAQDGWRELLLDGYCKPFKEFCLMLCM
jgi:hypothetical protein